MISKDSAYLHGLNLLPQFGPVRITKLVKRLGGFKQAYSASAKQLAGVGLDEKIVRSFLVHRDKTNLDDELKKLERENINILSFKDPNYPKLLLEISKFPPILYYKGRMETADELCVAVVGTRKITDYGRMAVAKIVEPLAETGAVIVSGMAFGVDSAAHSLSIKQNRRTIAVLGGGLDEKSLYPKHHAFLAQQIIDAGGALLSEYPIGTQNFKEHFVARNRIISGLCAATIIIECGLKSGTLITAKYALEQNRAIYAVPGPIYSEQSEGPNNLLKMGAKPLTDVNDILEDLNLKTLPAEIQTQKQFADSQEENILLQLIKHEPVVINELIRTSGLDAGTVTSTLTFLEMKGRIRNLGGQQYVLSR